MFGRKIDHSPYRTLENRGSPVGLAGGLFSKPQGFALKYTQYSLVVALSLVAVALVARSTRKGNTTTQSYCVRCGLIRSVSEKRLSIPFAVKAFTYSRRCKYRPTAVSEALSIQECPHRWQDYWQGHDYGRALTGYWIHYGGDVAGAPVRAEVLSFESFAQTLAAGGQENSWEELAALLVSNPAQRQVFAELTMSDDFVKRFQLWWATNRAGPNTNAAEPTL